MVSVRWLYCMAAHHVLYPKHSLKVISAANHHLNSFTENSRTGRAAAPPTFITWQRWQHRIAAVTLTNAIYWRQSLLPTRGFPVRTAMPAGKL